MDISTINNLNEIGTGGRETQPLKSAIAVSRRTA